MIGFVPDVGTTAIKIGYSKKPGKRVAGLQTANSSKLVQIGTIPGT